MLKMRRYTFQQEHRAEDQGQGDIYSNMHLIRLFQEPEEEVIYIR